MPGSHPSSHAGNADRERGEVSKHTCPPRMRCEASLGGEMPMRDLAPLYWTGCDACRAKKEQEQENVYTADELRSVAKLAQRGGEAQVK